MKPAVWRLVLTATLFALWIGYLVYLWQATLFFRPSHEPLILSRPQFLVADLVIVGEIKDADSPVEVKEVLFPEKDADLKPGDVISVTNLNACHPPRSPVRTEPGPSPDLTGPGSYLLPLRPARKGPGYEVVPIPSSPTYTDPKGPPRIYPATPQTLAQYRAISR
jgi:hypothetical protein